MTYIALLCAAHYYSSTIPAPTTTTTTTECSTQMADTKALSLANTEFAWNLFQEIDKSQKSNIFYSPYSISTALLMTLLGARTNTSKQIKSTLRVAALSDEEIHRAASALQAVINQPDAPYALKTANRLFANNTYKFLTEFLDTTKKFYNAEAVSMDFAAHSEDSRKEINSWVEQQTANKIKDLLPAGLIDHMTAMILVNAIYFKGNWDKKFDVKDTTKEKFHVDSKKAIDVNMMHINKKYNISEREDLDCQVLELPYEKHDLSMFILLPNQLEGLKDLEKKLSASVLQTLSQNMDSNKVNISLPKFKLEQEFSLSETLSQLGMKDLFQSNTADLSGMDGTKALFVSKVIHKAFVDVNEEGTEAAAATGMAMCLMSMPIQKTFVFKADHPFLFFIRDNRNGAILFLGRLVEPLAAM